MINITLKNLLPNTDLTDYLVLMTESGRIAQLREGSINQPECAGKYEGEIRIAGSYEKYLIPVAWERTGLLPPNKEFCWVEIGPRFDNITDAVRWVMETRETQLARTAQLTVQLRNCLSAISCPF